MGLGAGSSMDADREYRLYRAASSVLGLLPEPVIRRGGYAAGWTTWLWADRRRTTAIRNMARARGESPDQPSATSKKMARRMFAAYGRYWAEVLWLRPSRVPQIDRHLEIEGIEHFQTALAAGRGAVFALPHIGNWEVAGLVAGRLGARLVAVAEKLPNRRLAEWFIRVRNTMGIDVMLADGSPRLIADLAGVLAANGAVALVTDRDVTRRGVKTEFFGEPTKLPGGAVTLHLQTGAPLMAAASYFSPGRGHKVVIKPPLPAFESMEEGMRLLVSDLEDLIVADPEQWHMVQPNWPQDFKR